MPLRPCIVCGALSTESRCPRHYRKRDTPGRTTRAQMAFRQAVLARAGHRCQWHDSNGRCTETTKLAAHHLEPFRDTQSYDPADGICLCLPHHREADARLSNARAA
jgi:predicted restriction endonuclease